MIRRAFFTRAAKPLKNPIRSSFFRIALSPALRAHLSQFVFSSASAAVCAKPTDFCTNMDNDVYRKLAQFDAVFRDPCTVMHKGKNAGPPDPTHHSHKTLPLIKNWLRSAKTGPRAPHACRVYI